MAQVTYRCPPSAVEAVAQLVSNIFPTLDPDVFLHNDIMLGPHRHPYNNEVGMEFRKTHASFIGDVPSYLGYSIIIRVPSLGYHERFTIYVYDPAVDNREVNQEAVKRALWCLLTRPVSVSMISIYVTRDYAGRVTGYDIRN